MYQTHVIHVNLLLHLFYFSMISMENIIRVVLTRVPMNLMKNYVPYVIFIIC
jgi:hypothetical protein